ncbi:MAG: DUF6625 family protein [Mucilaginibacter sp.]
MTKLKSIALVTCYFGKFPWYFDFFVHSCKFNPSVDFFVITDDKTYLKPTPENVKLIYKTLHDISRLATQKLEFKVNIGYPYKLCDFKPAYGVLFSEILEGYDFWGYGDIDVIFGNIRSFMTDELMAKYDLISVRPDWIPGCFILLRNIDKMTSLFTNSKDYKKVFTSDRHYCFDETNFAHDDFTDGKSYLEVETEIESMMHVVKKMEALGAIKPYFDLHIVEGVPGKLKWENGVMTYRKKYEILLYHLIRLKKNYNPRSRSLQLPHSFNISPSKIYFQSNQNCNK